jgi:hypothetical protein
MAKRKMLNVKSHLEHVIFTCDMMLERDGKYKGGLVLPPIDRDNLRELAFFAKTILRVHAAKGTRKDVYVNQ